MRWSHYTSLALLSVHLLGATAAQGDEPKAPDESKTAEGAKVLVGKAEAAARKGQMDRALELAHRAVKADPRSTSALELRSALFETRGEFRKALADHEKIIELKPSPRAHDRRGDLHFKIGDFKKAIRDYDLFIKANESRAPHHWRRGIAYYYAAEYVKGQKQFEGYQTIDASDVENAVWRYLCMARKFSPDVARKKILKIGDDRRIPMAEIYRLFAGELKPEDILAAAKRGQPDEITLNQRLFYGHLYLGLYYETEKKPVLAARHLDIAAKRKIGHFMWDVARVHAEIYRKAARIRAKQSR